MLTKTKSERDRSPMDGWFLHITPKLSLLEATAKVFFLPNLKIGKGNESGPGNLGSKVCDS